MDFDKIWNDQDCATAATAVAPSDSLSIYRSDLGSVAALSGTTSQQDKGSPKRLPQELSGVALPGYLICKASRDQRPSETANIGLSRVIEEVEERHTGDTAKVNERVVKKRLQLILGKGKWLDDFIATFQAPATSQTVSDQVS